MKVLVFNKQRDLSLAPSSVRPVVRQVLTSEKRITDEVSIYFVTRKEICRLHALYFNDPSPTDCITFPLDEDETLESYHVLGEIFICPKTAISYCTEKGNLSEKDIYRELTLYLVHGLLHLLGYDDIDTKMRQKMRRAESKHMKNLGNRLLMPKE